MNPNRSQSPPPGSPRSIPPGKPKDAGSRQQTHPEQATQTGSPGLDKDLTEDSGAGTPSVPTKPSGVK